MLRKPIKITTSDLNIKDTIESGQPLTFHSDFLRKNNWDILRYTTEKGVILISRNSSDGILRLDYFGDYTSNTAKKEVIFRLGINDDINKIYEKIKTDKFMEEAVNRFYGMRITTNPPWETTLCFLVSQFNNIKRIRLIMKNLINKFGEPYYIDGKKILLFPTPERISKASIQELMSCGTGFRAKYIKSVSTDVKNGFSLDHLNRLDYKEAKENLLKLDGVGDKVADCILLFGYKHYESFPIDVWIKRVVENIYLKGKKCNINDIHEFAYLKWGEYAGYAQQYLYWHGKNPLKNS
ncbi:MAG: hypothetical protein QXD23_03165 [Candidatus Micrarchaeaceae archaeon]